MMAHRMTTGHRLVRISVGVLLSAAVSWICARLFVGTELSTTVPLWFIGVLYVLARRYGVAVSIIGSLACAAIFAHSLFDPLGSWHVTSDVARRNLLWMVAGAIVVPYLLQPSASKDTSQIDDRG